MYNKAMKKLCLLSALAAATVLPAFAEEVEDNPSYGYVGAASGMFLPGNGNSLKRAALVTVRGGWYLNDYFAIETEALCAPHVSSGEGGTTVWGGSAQALWHLSGWEAFDKLFGCERFAPFLTGGLQALCATRHVFADDSHRTGIGPTAGIGAFYHLTDNVSLRFDARAALAVDSPCGMTYSLLAGLQYSFGD